MPREQRDQAGGLIERRAIAGLEIRAAGEGGVQVAGYAAVFGERADIGGWFTEEIMPGAFREALRRGDDVPLLIEHQGLPLARTTSGRLRLAEDARGLAIEADLNPEDPDVARVIPKMQAGELNAMSFAFRAEREEWDHSAEPEHRRILQVRLYDVAVVVHPAYSGTEIALRSRAASREASITSPGSAGVCRAATETLRRRLALSEAAMRRHRGA